MGNVGPVTVKFREKGNELIVASVFTIVLKIWKKEMIRSMSWKKARLSLYADVIVYMENYRESKIKGDREGKGWGERGGERDMKLK